MSKSDGLTVPRQNSRSPANLTAPIPVGKRSPALSASTSPPTLSRRGSYFGSIRLSQEDEGRPDRPLLSAEPEDMDEQVLSDETDRALRRRGMDKVADFRGKAKEWFGNNTGLLLIGGAQCFFASMNSSVKLLQDPKQGGGLPTLQLIAIRMSITFLGCISYLFYTGDPNPILGPPDVRRLLALRGFIGFFGLCGMYQSLQHLSLSEATTLGFLGPVGTGILGYLVLKEPYTRREATAGLISLIGVVLIARPTALFGSTPEISNGLPVSPDWGGEVAAGSRTSWHDKVYDPDTGAVIRRDTQAERLASVGFALLGVCGASGAYIAVRAIGHRARPFHSISYFSFYCVVVSVVGMIVLGTPLVFPQTVLGWGLIAIIGVFGLGAQILVTMGLQREKAGRGSLAMYTQLLFAGLVERFLFHTRLTFTSVIGTIIIIGAALWVAFSKKEQPRSNPRDIESDPRRTVEDRTFTTHDGPDPTWIRLGQSLGPSRRDGGRDGGRNDGQDQDRERNLDEDEDEAGGGGGERATPGLGDETKEVPLPRSGLRQGVGSEAERRRRGGLGIGVGATLGQGWMEGEKKGVKADEGRKGLERSGSGSGGGAGLGTSRR